MRPRCFLSSLGVGLLRSHGSLLGLSGGQTLFVQVSADQIANRAADDRAGSDALGLGEQVADRGARHPLGQNAEQTAYNIAECHAERSALEAHARQTQNAHIGRVDVRFFLFLVGLVIACQVGVVLVGYEVVVAGLGRQGFGFRLIRQSGRFLLLHRSILIRRSGLRLRRGLLLLLIQRLLVLAHKWAHPLVCGLTEWKALSGLQPRR